MFVKEARLLSGVVIAYQEHYKFESTYDNTNKYIHSGSTHWRHNIYFSLSLNAVILRRLYCLIYVLFVYVVISEIIKLKPKTILANGHDALYVWTEWFLVSVNIAIH